jgi:hypothetical protein
MIAPKKAAQYMLRLPPGLRTLVANRAAENGRSMNTEIIDAIQRHLGVAGSRMEALEKRVYKLEDVVNEILRRGAGVGTVVQPTSRTADEQQLPPYRDPEGRAEQTVSGLPVSSGGGKTVA